MRIEVPLVALSLAVAAACGDEVASCNFESARYSDTSDFAADEWPFAGTGHAPEAVEACKASPCLTRSSAICQAVRAGIGDGLSEPQAALAIDTDTKPVWVVWVLTFDDQDSVGGVRYVIDARGGQFRRSSEFAAILD